MIIIHGDDYVASRNYLNGLIEEAQKNNQAINRLEADKLELAEVVQIIESVGFFGVNYLLVIYGFFSAPKSNKRDRFLDYFKEHQDANLVLYESKDINATSLKSFAQATISHHKPAPLIFSFLDSLKPGSGPNAITQFKRVLDQKTPTELIFAMLVRQIRLLIQAGEPTTLKMAPWMKNKLVSQSRAFGEEKLLKLHDQLYQIDKNIKTGKNPTGLELQLFDLFLSL